MTKPYYQDEQAGITIYCGDAFEILPELEAGVADKALVDPPYNAKDIGVKSKSYNGVNMHVSEAEYTEFCRSWFEAVKRITPNIMLTPGIRDMYSYPKPKWVLCWHKPGAVCYNFTGGFNIWEPILVYGKCGSFVEDYFCSTPRNFSNGPEKDHPCPKNIGLWKWLVNFGTIPGDTVIDCFGGSGTTALACKVLGRKAILIEQVEAYCEIAVKRLAQSVMTFPELSALEDKK